MGVHVKFAPKAIPPFATQGNLANLSRQRLIVKTSTVERKLSHHTKNSRKNFIVKTLESFMCLQVFVKCETLTGATSLCTCCQTLVYQLAARPLA